MLIYDIKRTAKFTLIPCLAAVLVQIFLGLVGGVSAALYLAGAVLIILVNFGLFKRDYAGRDAALINMLPVSPFIKILTKLSVGYILLFFYTYLFIFIGFRDLIYYMRPQIFTMALMVFLGGYTSLGLIKYSGKLYVAVGAMLLILAAGLLIGRVAGILLGGGFVCTAHLLICILLWIVCMRCIER